MFCTQCGNEAGELAKFCSKCGRELAPGQAQQKSQHDMNLHINILGWLLVGSAILDGILGMMIIFAGQLIQRFPNVLPPNIPFDALRLAGSVAAFVGLVVIATAVGIAAAGIGLLQHRNWARVVAIIMSFLMIFKFPLGTAIAIYAFWVLFSQDGREYFQSQTIVG